jgi:hypothetical protein
MSAYADFYVARRRAIPVTLGTVVALVQFSIAPQVFA